ncbi:aspartate/glutamate racemase family protein [Agrobacterium larrymoorei]|uniref:Amino acid racemase n=1 Tax=Agrobacterium larrymoorei TaxID=160699 RepID=A0AAF0H7M5_9HYPH|nr:amino acid racemase [Agrobacterium larrymoorei]WHA40562.1 amino acid racemase [Agrobacterium larrymoorei]
MLDFTEANRTIGIIGGAGVAASAELVRRIEEKITAFGAFRDSQHPELLLYNATQVPSRSMYLEGRGESFVPGYVKAAEKLKNAGASFVAMCCNTAHYARQQIADEADVTIINLLAESLTAALAAAPDARRIGVLCADGTRSIDLYGVEAAKLGLAVEIVYPDAAFQEMLTRGICNIKKGYHRTLPVSDAERPAHLYALAAANLVEKEVDAIVLGCTEIPLDFAEVEVAVPCIDTIEVLADVCIAMAAGSRNLAK